MCVEGGFSQIWSHIYHSNNIIIANICMFRFTSYNHTNYVDCHSEHKMSDHKYEEIDTTLCDSNNQDWLGDMKSQGAISAVHISDKRRNLSVSYSKSRLQINGT